IGALVLFPLLLARGESLKPPPWRLTLAVGVTQTAAFQGLTQWALVGGGAGHTSLLAYTMPFWAVLLAWLLLAERPSRQQSVGLARAAAGRVCIMEPWQGLGGFGSTLWAVTAGISWALSVVLTKRMFQLHAPSALAFTAWQMLFGALLLCVVAMLAPSQPIDWTAEFVFGLLYSAVLASSLAWFLWSVIVQRLPTAVASLSSLGVPITVVFMAWFFLQERPDRVEALGILFIVLGLVAVSGIARRRSISAPADDKLQ